ncbi:MAG: hypothetical protein AABY15_06545 [Nanoarchaeota archaeon]
MTDTVEVKTKNGVINRKRTLNTLSFPDVEEERVPEILKQIEEEGKGIPMKHYLSNVSVPGRASGKKKK